AGRADTIDERQGRRIRSEVHYPCAHYRVTMAAGVSTAAPGGESLAARGENSSCHYSDNEEEAMMIIRELTHNQCISLIEAKRVARLGCSLDGQPYVVTIFYAYAEGHAYAFTLPGRKLDIMRANPKVALLVEETGSGRSWKSAMAEGSFEELPDRIGHKTLRERAWTLLSKYSDWWQPGALKPELPP